MGGEERWHVDGGPKPPARLESGSVPLCFFPPRFTAMHCKHTRSIRTLDGPSFSSFFVELFTPRAEKLIFHRARILFRLFAGVN